MALILRHVPLFGDMDQRVGFYERRILPHLIGVAMRQDILLPYRRRLVEAADGRVLEIGVGTGLNLPFYQRATRVIGLDPSARLLAMARHATTHPACPVDLIDGAAEAIPLAAASVDTVVTAWTLCSVRDVTQALAEIRRVLRPAGRLLFVEHGRAPDAAVARWQHRLTPAWRYLAGGCHLNRPVEEILRQAGFTIERLEAAYMKGPRLLTFMYEGSALQSPHVPHTRA